MPIFEKQGRSKNKAVGIKEKALLFLQGWGKMYGN